MTYYSPLRYPGGKNKLTNYIKVLMKENSLLDGTYVEPFAGGAGVALSLLMNEYVSDIVINDLNNSVYAFWHSVLHFPDTICSMIEQSPITMDEWIKQKQIQKNEESSLIELGFSTFFLNRTNRSGIINGGVIGGNDQSGNWKLDARFNKVDLIRRIQSIARYKDRIKLYNLDLIRDVLPQLSKKTLIYFDPPYYVKGQKLYQNHFIHDDHSDLATIVKDSVEQYWLITYDNTPIIQGLYSEYRQQTYTLNYSAATSYKGSEIMVFCDKLIIPNIIDPAKAKVN